MKDGLESLGRVRAKGISLLLITFVAGSLAGVALERVMAARRAPELGPGMGMMQPGMDVPFPRMFRELDLTPEQMTEIREIMERSRPHTEEILQETLPRLRAVTDSVRGEIRAVLSAEQAAKMDSMMAQWGDRPPGFPGRGRGMPGRPDGRSPNRQPPR